MQRVDEFLAKAKLLARSRDGYCISNTYVNIYTNLEWVCAEQHTWFASYESVKRGSWCPQCKIFRYEEICRLYMEEIFNEPFLKVRPEWLRSPKQVRMELDGYSSKLGIAFEHNGYHHYTNKSAAKLAYTKLKDQIKVDLCHEHGVKLIVIPDLHKLKIENLLPFILDRCDMLDISVPRSISSIDIDNFKWNKIYCRPILDRLRHIAITKGGRLISTRYINAVTKLTWECRNGHTWQATSKSIQHGCWCPYCAHNIPSIEDMHKLARHHNGKCLSEEYKTSKTKLLWECEKGHTWHAQPHNIKLGTWCPFCNKGSKPIHTIEEMKMIAQNRYGECLSDVYNSTTPLIWKCDIHDYVWHALPHSILSGTWCPKCAIIKNKQQRITPMYKIQQIAAEFGGKCLSHTYECSEYKLLWQCKNHHIWLAKLSDVKKGHWCKQCNFSKLRKNK